MSQPLRESQKMRHCVRIFICLGFVILFCTNSWAMQKREWPSVIGVKYQSATHSETKSESSGKNAFQKPIFISGTGSATTILTVDYNQDGVTDLIERAGNVITIHLANSDGSFSDNKVYQLNLEEFFATNESLPLLAAADLDNNQTLELILPVPGTFVVIFNSGFKEDTGYIFTLRVSPSTSSPNSIETTDFDNDGDIDIVLADEMANLVLVLFNNGAGIFGRSMTFETGLKPKKVAIDDLNSDGTKDLVIANVGSNSISVVLGGETLATVSSISLPMSPETVIINDLNGDNNLDVMVASQGPFGKFGILFGDGNGEFNLVLSSVDLPPVGGAVSGNFVGDQKPEIIFTHPESKKLTLVTFSESGIEASSLQFEGVKSPILLETDDLNRDGFPDLILATKNKKKSIVILLNAGTTKGE
ncbi:MAG: VCBS repeat-containing protein [Acidobacteria bacterium]|nr:VCBS repeat-containing protein [Acidobacteriota bacterium]